MIQRFLVLGALSSALALSALWGCGSDPSPAPMDQGADQGADMARADMTPDQALPSDQGLDQALARDQGVDQGADLALADLALADMAADAGADVGADAGADMSAGVARPGFGALSGDCQVLDDELVSADSTAFFNTLDFMSDPFDASDYAQLSVGGKKIYDDDNAGGSSKASEIFAYEVLHRCEDASLLKTENEIRYSAPGKITDLMVQIDAHKLGVSVARAYAFMRPFTLSDAQTLLNNKLGGINASSALVVPEDKWRKQILSIIVYDQQTLTVLTQAIEQADPVLRADTIIIATLTRGQDCWLYTSSPSCMPSE